MSEQFEKWAARLALEGYAVLLPSSYGARGFCDKHVDGRKIPKKFNKEQEQVIGRLYDVDAAGRWLCARDDIDCKRVGLLGFSQGGTTVMFALHREVNHALVRYRNKPHNGVDFKIRRLEEDRRPVFRTGVAYYPGCGFDNVIPLNSTKTKDKYSPIAPLQILHAELDTHHENLLDECVGKRKLQAAEVAAKLGEENFYNIEVFPDVDHGFDKPDCNNKACKDAKKLAIAALATQLKPRLPLREDVVAPEPSRETPVPNAETIAQDRPCILWDGAQIHACLQMIDPRLADLFRVVRDLVTEVTRRYFGSCKDLYHAS